MKSKWIVSLSDGSTYSEDKPLEPLDCSPWLNLVDLVLSEDLEVRHIKGVVNGIVFNSPTFGAIGQFHNDGKAHRLFVAHRQVLVYGGPKRNIGYLDISYQVGDDKTGCRHHIIIQEDTCESWQATTKLGEHTDKFINTWCETHHNGKRWR